MDAEDLAFEDYRDAVKDLAKVNSLSFGYRPTLRFLRSLPWPEGRPLVIVDIGSGYGDQLRVMADECQRLGRAARLIGVDRSPHAASAAPSWDGEGSDVTVEYVTDDAAALIAKGQRADIFTASLLTHHLEESELVGLLEFMEESAALGWFVNDLYRSRTAALGFELAVHGLRLHPMVRHDGPVSFARSFRRREWLELLELAGVQNAEVQLHHPYRLCVARLKAAFVEPSAHGGRAAAADIDHAPS
ncbi:MAG: methyltransferase domain-containing protein [Parvularcula sp.]|jgi:SAM-dependent methyltransferase|nr:methyltransferase domain-containing protein [Parvularcula sp.]